MENYPEAEINLERSAVFAKRMTYAPYFMGKISFISVLLSLGALYKATSHLLDAFRTAYEPNFEPCQAEVLPKLEEHW